MKRCLLSCTEFRLNTKYGSSGADRYEMIYFIIELCCLYLYIVMKAEETAEDMGGEGVPVSHLISAI